MYKAIINPLNPALKRELELKDDPQWKQFDVVSIMIDAVVKEYEVRSVTTSEFSPNGNSKYTYSRTYNLMPNV